jgi:hypothetical protein
MLLLSQSTDHQTKKVPGGGDLDVGSYNFLFGVALFVGESYSIEIISVKSAAG